jgi:AAA domain-containing protein
MMAENNPNVPSGPAQPIKPDLGGFLSGITYGKQIKPIFCLIHGPDGVGKSTWPSKAPNPVYIGTENGSNQLDVARLPQPETLDELNKQLTGLFRQEHPFKTLVLDSIDWVQPLIHKDVCLQGQVKTIVDFAGGYGKGFERAQEIWRELVRKLAKLALHYHVILIAHSRIEKFDDPQQPGPYDRYEIALRDDPAALIRQAVDAVLFATFKEKVRQTSKNQGKGIGEGERCIYTEHRPAFDAKNRFNLPFELPLEWKAFAECVKKFYFGQSGGQEGGADETNKPPPSGPEPSAPSALPAGETKGSDDTKKDGPDPAQT